MNNIEIWKWAPGYEDLYQVSSFGRVLSYKRKTPYFLKLRYNNMGYAYVDLSKDGLKRYLVSRLVAFSFLPNPENKPEVAHNDGNPLNNTVWNLRWATRKENNDDKIMHNTEIRGENRSMSKLKNHQVILIFNSIKSRSELAKEYGVDKNTIKRIKNRKIWTHITGDLP